MKFKKKVEVKGINFEIWLNFIDLHIFTCVYVEGNEMAFKLADANYVDSEVLETHLLRVDKWINAKAESLTGYENVARMLQNVGYMTQK